MKPVHHLPAELLTRQISVHLVGCGGTGSQMLTNLSRLHLALVALGHPAGLHVTVIDPDRVSPSNVGRQLFSRADIGHFKAEVLVNRINCYYGLLWRALPVRYEVGGAGLEADIVITCVDTAQARRDIGQALMPQIWRAPIYWLDCGNAQQTGQVMLTELREIIVRQTIGDPHMVNMPKEVQEKVRSHAERHDVILPPLWVALPDVFDASIPEDDRPSCSLAEALGEQGLFINAHVAHWGATILERLLRESQIDVHGYWINLLDGVIPVPVPSLATALDQERTMKVVTNG